MTGVSLQQTDKQKKPVGLNNALDLAEFPSGFSAQRVLVLKLNAQYENSMGYLVKIGIQPGLIKNKFTLHAVSVNELQKSVHYNKP